MKNALGFLIPFMALVLVAYLGKPSDQECVDQVPATHAGSVVSALASGSVLERGLYQVEDHFFYKTIYFAGARVGYGALWHVIC